jgi:hypothetical protein
MYASYVVPSDLYGGQSECLYTHAALGTLPLPTGNRSPLLETSHGQMLVSTLKYHVVDAQRVERRRPQLTSVVEEEDSDSSGSLPRRRS